MVTPFAASNLTEQDSSGSDGAEGSHNVPHPCRTFVGAASFVAMTVFMQWCVLDFYVVRMIPYPEHVDDYDWTFLMFPLLPLLALLAWSKWPGSSMTLGTIVVAVVFGVIFSIPLIAVCGVWFHFSIGGTL